MITKTNSLEERSLEIYETDFINGGNVLILKVYFHNFAGILFPKRSDFNGNRHNLRKF